MSHFYLITYFSVSFVTNTNKDKLEPYEAIITDEH